MSQPEQLNGTIEKIVFQSTDTGFTVFVLQVSHANSTTVTGNFASIHPGEYVSLMGTWSTHKKFGKQFVATQCTTQMPTSVLGLKKYLGSGLIKGIGKVYAEKLVDAFGVNVLDIIEKEPHKLGKVQGIGPKRLEQIITAWHDQKEISSIMLFLQEKDVSPVLATKIYKHYGKESIAMLNENPYRLVQDIWGIGFKTADGIAQKLGLPHDSIKRIKAGINFAIQDATNRGHLYVELETLKESVITLLELKGETIEQKVKTALHELYNENNIKLITHDAVHYITLSLYYFTEKNLAQKIKNVMQHKSPYLFDLDEVYKTISQPPPGKLALNEEQQRGILGCLQDKVTVITGGPGTGKTTLIKQLLEILDDYRLIYRLAAPTGRAAKRITEGTGRHAATLHRLLEFDPSIMSFKHNESNALTLDFLIIDEASMLDVFLAYALMKALPLTAHIVFIGDTDQLPSVGAGNVLHDIIATKTIPFVRLQHIFRQAQDSMIILNAHKINNGEFPTSSHDGAKRDFMYIKEEDPSQVPAILEDIFTNHLKRYGIAPEQATVLVPMNRGIVGTQKINHDLQGLLNPDPSLPHVMRFGTAYKVGDRVMQLRNNYDKVVFNGDIGTIESVDQEEQQLTVLFDERLIIYEFDELDELVLAYAISIHKSQGSEYAACIVPIFMQHFMLLQRNLIYTAITRAKRLCIFIGQSRAIAMGVKNDKQQIRITFLTHYITTDLTCT
ncbi:MAG: ATP-dependent RecD-like DNA helicase [Candidatus Babeliales bacterium]